MSRLLRLMTRRYRSFRSEVAKRPPSSWTIGRRSGGMTGRTDRIIHSGRVPERRNASIRRRRLIAFLRRWPELVRTSTWSARAERLEVHPADDVAHGLGAHAGGEQAALAGLVELLVERPELGLADGQHRLDRLELVAQLAQLVLEALGLLLELALLGARASRPSRRAGRRPSGRRRSASSRSRCWISSLTRSVSAPTTARSLAVAVLPPFSPAATMTSPVGSKTIDSSAAAVFSSARRASTCWAAATISSVRLARWVSSSALVALSAAVSSSRFRSMSALSSASSSPMRLPDSPPRPAASSSMFAAKRLRDFLVDARDDVQGEVQDPLEVARADVEQDAQARAACP